MKKLILVLFGAVLLQSQLFSQSEIITSQFVENSTSGISNATVVESKDSSEAISDSRVRMVILNFIEEMRGFYLNKDIDALRKLYSDDGLIVSDGILRPIRPNVDISNCVRYRRESKAEFLRNIEKLFQKKGNIEVVFDNISIVHHPTKSQYYGVSLHQTLKTDYYQDEGWFFMLWDFTNQDHPVIPVRTWQPKEVVEMDGIFGLDDLLL